MPSCRVCLSRDTTPWLDFGAQPNSTLMRLETGLLLPKRSLLFHHCKDCGFIFLEDSWPADELYGSSQLATSFLPARHLDALIQAVIARLSGIRNPDVYEIGCNDGHFLSKLRSAGLHRLRGIEPSARCAGLARTGGFDVQTGFFTRAIAQALLSAGPAPHLVACRHVLEHVLDLDDFMGGLQLLAQAGSQILVETPDLEALGLRGDPSLLWDQHVNYFDLPVLHRLAGRFSLHLRESWRVPHGGGALVAFLEPGPSTPVPTPDRTGWRRRVKYTLHVVESTLSGLHEQGFRIAAFGAGTRGTMLVNLAGIAPYLDFVVDENPEKLGRFLPGSSLPIVAPKSMRSQAPDYCLVLPLNAKESELVVMSRRRELLSINGRFLEYLPEDGSLLRIIEPQTHA